MLEAELNSKLKERELSIEKESTLRLSLQRVQNELSESKEKFKRLNEKVRINLILYVIVFVSP